MGTVLYSNAQLSASAADLFIVQGDGRYSHGAQQQKHIPPSPVRRRGCIEQYFTSLVLIY